MVSVDTVPPRFADGSRTVAPGLLSPWITPAARAAAAADWLRTTPTRRADIPLTGDRNRSRVEERPCASVSEMSAGAEREGLSSTTARDTKGDKMSGALLAIWWIGAIGTCSWYWLSRGRQAEFLVGRMLGFLS